MHVGPNLEYSLAIAGMLSIYGEFVWPGRVWLGALGSLALIFGIYGLWRDSPSQRGLLLLALSAALFLIETFRELRLIPGTIGTIAMAAGSCMLFDGPRRIAPLLACVLSLVFGAVTIYLGNGAKAARRAKRVDL